MITKYNAPNEVLFLKSNLGSYRVMALDTFQTKESNPSLVPNQKESSLQDLVSQFIDNMVTNLQYLGEDGHSNILFL